MKIDIKSFVKSIILGVSCVIALIMLWKGLSMMKPTDTTDYQKTIDSLQKHSDSLFLYISATENHVNSMKDTIDSLESLKPKIVIRYVNKYKEIDSASVGTVVSKFDSIFAKSGINR